jgi:N-methylhydantoinase B
MAVDPITLEVFNHRLSAIAEEMGSALCRSAFSPNIKERRDYSCALFDDHGEMAAQAAHIPVHLGSTPLSVRAAIAATAMRRGDVIMLNDPYAGGTHLPDVTLVAPIHLASGNKPFGYVANRAHHADIGGSAPGSMPLATEIYQEGLRLPPVHLMTAGRIEEDILRLFTANTRVADERRGDLLAQLAALRLGQQRVADLVHRSGRAATQRAMRALQDYSERLMAATLRRLRQGRFHAEDFMDDDGVGRRRIAIRVAIRIGRGRATVDFTGTEAQTAGGINANQAVTLAAVLYAFQCLAGAAIPANAGLMRPIRVIAPPGSLVNAEFPAAVAGGNVETSQRIVDVVFKALARAAPGRIPAASSGSMNNVAIGGHDPIRGREFAYYETIAGGAGAGPNGPGASGIHTHMTNTLNTPIEALEAAYPMRITRYGLRHRSGGNGRHRGGDGVVREIEALAPMHVTLLTERRSLRPYGMAGGKDGAAGRNILLKSGAAPVTMPAKAGFHIAAGNRIRVETPGGGGWGKRKTS